jgi:hypothetical protein
VDELGGPQQLTENVALVDVLQQAALLDDSIQVSVWGREGVKKDIQVSLGGTGVSGGVYPTLNPPGPQPILGSPCLASLQHLRPAVCQHSNKVLWNYFHTFFI